MIFDRYAASGSTGEEYDIGVLKQFSHNLVSPNSTNRISLGSRSSDISYQNNHLHNGYSRSNSPSHTFGADSTLLINTLPHTPAHMEHLFNSKLHAERLLLESAQLQESNCDLKPHENGVFAKQYLRRGTRFGPFALSESMGKSNAWDILPMSQIRSFLEPSTEVKSILKKIRTISASECIKEANFNQFFVAGCLWYESNRDIDAGEEIVIDGRPKTLFEHNELVTNGEAHNGSSINSSDDRSDRDNVSFYGSNINCDESLKNDQSSDNVKNELSDDENGFDIRCEVCDKTFVELKSLDDHLVGAHHFRKEEFFCELCSQRFCHRPLLLKHRALQHNEIRKYPCENCTKVFCDPSNLQRHIRNHHIGARSHACPECGKTFATSSGLKQHTHIHSSVKPFQCEVCFKAYTQFSNLCRHRRMHANCRMQIKCSKCGQSFSTVTSLSKHKRFCDSTNIPATGVGLPNNPLHTFQHQSQQPQSSAQPRTGGINGTLQANMATPPNPFIFWRPPFFPTFPPAAAAFGLQGMFSQPTGNFTPMFPKPSVDLKLQQMKCQALNNPTTNHNDNVSSANSNNKSNNNNNHSPNTKTSSVSINVTNHEPNAGTIRDAFGLFMPKLEMSYNSQSEDNLRELKMDVQRFTSDEESKESINVELKNTNIETLKREEIEDDCSLRIAEDDKVSNGQDSCIKKSIDILSVSPRHETESKGSYNELPLDLSVSRKRGSIESDLSQEVLKSSHEDTNNSINIREINHIAQDELSNSDSFEPLKKQKAFNSSVNSSRTPTSSPGPTPSPSPPCNVSSSAIRDNNSAILPTCPRPMHPIILDELYRTHALESTFPRPFPFLGLMGDRTSIDGNSLRAREDTFVPEPVFREALRGFSSGALQVNPSGKLKDRYTCKFCGKIFPRSANLTRHLRTHTGEQPYTCKYCDRAFSISSNLQRHVRNIHNKERPFRCHLCDRCFGQQTNLDRHLKKHESDTTGLGLAISDSPSSNEADREDSYFDEIRNFMDRVTYNEDLYTPSSIGNAENDTDYNASDNENELSVSRSSSTDLTVDPSKTSDAQNAMAED